jgi:hypothetical protein
MAWIGPCGHKTIPGLDCAECARLEREREWDSQHPDKGKYLEENGWQRAKLEKGFPGHREYLGWWHEKFCLVHQRYFDIDQAVRIQRQADEGREPLIIYAEDGFKVL